MKRLSYAAAFGVALALPAWASAASPTPTPPGPGLIPFDFAVVPGCQFAPSCHPHPAKPQLSFSYTLAPGQTIHDTVAVMNPSKSGPITINLSVADGVTPARGAGITFNSTGTLHQVGSWIHLSNTSTTVPAGYISLTPLTISIPRSVKPGEYTGAVIGASAKATIVTAGKIHYAMHGAKRCLVMVRVVGQASAGLQIVSASAGVAAAQKQAAFGVMLKNTGTVIDRPTAAVLTFTGSGKTYTVRPPIGAIAGGAATTVSWLLGNAVPPGAYRVSVQIAYLAQPDPRRPAQSLHTTWAGSVSVPRSTG